MSPEVFIPEEAVLPRVTDLLLYLSVREYHSITRCAGTEVSFKVLFDWVSFLQDRKCIWKKAQVSRVSGWALKFCAGLVVLGHF